MCRRPNATTGKQKLEEEVRDRRRLIARGAGMPQADIKDFESPHLPSGLSQTVEAMREDERY